MSQPVKKYISRKAAIVIVRPRKLIEKFYNIIRYVAEIFFDCKIRQRYRYKCFERTSISLYRWLKKKKKTAKSMFHGRLNSLGNYNFFNGENVMNFSRKSIGVFRFRRIFFSISKTRTIVG